MAPADRAQFVWMQNAEPPGLYCADESDGEALRVCEQFGESLYSYEVAGTAAGITGVLAATSFITVQQMLSGALVTGIVTLGALLATMAFFEYERWSTPKSINSILSAAGISVQGKKQLLAEEF